MTRAGDEKQMIYAIRDLTFTYPGTDRAVLNGVSLDIAPGEIIAILGPNGAGKTTLFSLMMGFLKPDQGEILLGGKPLERMNHKEVAGIVGYVPQIHEPSFDYTVKDFVLMGTGPQKGMFQNTTKDDEERCLAILEEIGIVDLAERSYLKISGGERQQALIARAMMQEPKIILFDEPTAHLDYGNAYRTLKMVKRMSEKGFAVAITTHDPNQALLLGGNAAVLDRSGHLISGPTEKIVTEDRLAEVYDCDLKLIRIDEMDRTACIAPKL